MGWAKVTVKNVGPQERQMYLSLPPSNPPLSFFPYHKSWAPARSAFIRGYKKVEPHKSSWLQSLNELHIRGREEEAYNRPMARSIIRNGT